MRKNIGSFLLCIGVVAALALAMSYKPVAAATPMPHDCGDSMCICLLTSDEGETDSSTWPSCVTSVDAVLLSQHHGCCERSTTPYCTAYACSYNLKITINGDVNNLCSNMKIKKLFTTVAECGTCGELSYESDVTDLSCGAGTSFTVTANGTTLANPTVSCSSGNCGGS